MAPFHFVSVVFTLCCCARADMSPFSCDFEQGLCNWTVFNDPKDSAYTWESGIADKLTSNNRPNKDHTLESSAGTYIYTDTTKGSTEDETYFISKFIQPSLRQCVTFWYYMYMYGNDGSTLSMYHNYYEEKENVKIWSALKSKESKWNYQVISLPDTNRDYRVAFEAVRGQGRGFIAVDDIIIASRDCYVSEHDCNFETDCPRLTWTEGNYQWEKNSGKTSTSKTGPKYDHTTGLSDGTYEYLEANGISMGTEADLILSPIQRLGDSCLTFWYHMYGDQMGELRVYKMNEETKHGLWNRSGNQENYWHQAFVDIYSDESYTIIFKGIRGTGRRSDIAIDDIYLIPQTCSEFKGALSHLTIETQDLTMPRKEAQSQDGQNTAVTGGIIAGVIILACAVVVLIFVLRRSQHCKREPKPQTKLQNNTVNLAAAGDYRSDYTGNQDIALPHASGHAIQFAIVKDVDQQYDEIGSIRHEEHTYTDIDKMTEEQTRPQYEYVDSEINGCIKRNKQNTSHVNGYLSSKDIESKNNKSPYLFAKEDNLESNITEDYAVPDPNETGFNRSNVITDVAIDAHNKPDRSTNMENDLTTKLEDQYDVSNDETYDASNNNRHKEAENNVYSHTVDNVYDTSSHKRAEQENENAYDHFFEDRSADDKA